MGIKDLKSLIRKHSPNSINSRKLSHYSGKKIAIDTYIYLYRFLSYGNHLSGFVRQILMLLEHNITPVYIFDGKPPDEKWEVILERKEKKEKNMEIRMEIENKLQEAFDPAEIKELQKQLFEINKKLISITPDHLAKAKELFNLFGVPYMVADGEAEILCAKLAQKGLVDACLSEDTDLLPNGAPIFINNLKNGFVEEYNLKVILEDMKINMEQFIDLCILCGCDYTNKIEGLAKDGAYTFIKKFINIEGIINYIKFYNKKVGKEKYRVPEDFNYQRAREIFNTKIEELINPDDIKIKRKSIRPQTLEDFVTMNCDRLAKRYHKQVKILCKNKSITKISSINQFSSPKIDSYFTPIP